MDQPSSSGYSYPPFWSYPPYFTLQPVKDTRERQSGLWGQLILDYCRKHKIYVINTGAEFPPFHNPAINRRLQHSAIIAFLDDLVSQGNAEWLDKHKRQCLVLWRKVSDWADTIYNFVRTYGLTDSVMVVDDLSSGDDVAGTDLAGLDRTLLLRALKLLESRGKARLFKGDTPEEEGVKFFG
ncbi:ESCRT-II complex subunit-domain-containing protein [Dunaliella salina]|uniref:ESCRT-II complex subunit-domain-containing protein n=1 Tax=Dunaliella salina TaxID=3046 RepID=A0ABQ7GH89_DUNSA|nr:ESCRT-II complex subunit-domain-containing protein [Dunaliella salina]|eukprot:KAF5833980.1 ESCRT-II complex subunit-domain-containing protein [Dunaliella salina]